MKQEAQKENLLSQLAKSKAVAQKSGTNLSNFAKFQSGKSRNATKGPIGPNRGGRNAQGKP